MYRRHVLRFALLALLLLGGVAWPQRAAASGAPGVSSFFYHNGYLVTGPFLAFFAASGGEAAFGGPRTDVFVDADGVTVQYFDQARFELRDGRIGLTALGRRAAANHPDSAAFAWVGPDQPHAEGRTYVRESGHTLGGAFAWFWQTSGAVPVLGFPISEEFSETQPDGSPALVQFFERAVLRYHAADGSVSRAALGARFAPARPTSAPPAVLAAVRMAFRPGSPDGHNIAVAAAKLDGHVLAAGEKLAFLGAVGPITEANGYGPGSAIEGGKIVNDAIGGGICTVSRPLLEAR